MNYYNGPKYIFNVSENDNFKIAIEEIVAIAAMDIAVKFGAKEVIFSGQNLAYIGNKSHTKSYENIWI
ncbi:hypothetical protein [Clostridium sp.]|uniref:hypothetical protein n=1 Tax=Clostridium sp. TaxID=1506 RepID=UPI002621F08B|nr:hypothetical protein [Clostridium sp.]